MLPTHRPLNADEVAHVRGLIAHHLQDTGQTLPQLASLIGCSSKALLKFTDEKHDETQDDFCRRVDKFFKQRFSNGGAALPTEIVTTSVTSNMLAVIHSVVRLGSIGAIVGPSGIGKSTVFRAVTRGIINGSAYIELSSVDASKSAVIARIAKELGGPARYRMQASFNWVIDHLSQTRRLIILDECHYLSESAFQVIRDIHKRTGCPVVLGGTQDLLKTINDFTPFQGQFKRLVSLVYNITEECQVEHKQPDGTTLRKPLYTVDEVVNFATASGIRLTINAAEIATDLANLLGWGGFGSLGFLLINAQHIAIREAEINGRPSHRVHVHDRHVDHALRQMEGASGFDRVKHRSTEQTQRKVAVA